MDIIDAATMSRSNVRLVLLNIRENEIGDQRRTIPTIRSNQPKFRETKLLKIFLVQKNIWGEKIWRENDFEQN